MNLHDVNQYREEKDHHMRHGHMSKEDRHARTEFGRRYGFLNQEDKHYHSPDRPEPMEGEY